MEKLALLILVFLSVSGSGVVKAGGGGGGMSTSLIDKGKHCIEAAREAYTALSNGRDTDEVLGHLQALVEDGKYLQHGAENSLSKLASQEEGLRKTLHQLQEDKKKFEMEILAVKKEKSAIEGTHSSKQALLRDNDAQVKRAEKEIQDAENELHKAKKKLKKKKRGLGGFVKSAVNSLVGRKSSAEKKVKRAKENAKRRRDELKAAQNEAAKTKQALTAVQNKINEHEKKIQVTQQQADKKHNEIGAIKNSIAFVKRSVKFWEEFAGAANSAENRSVRLKGIVDIAAEKGDYTLLRADGTTTVAKSFLMAWEVMATDYFIA